MPLRASAVRSQSSIFRPHGGFQGGILAVLEDEDLGGVVDVEVADHECRRGIVVRGIVPSRQFTWDLQLRRTRSPGQELTNGLRHFKQKRVLAS